MKAQRQSHNQGSSKKLYRKNRSSGRTGLFPSLVAMIFTARICVVRPLWVPRNVIHAEALFSVRRGGAYFSPRNNNNIINNDPNVFHRVNGSYRSMSAGGASDEKENIREQNTVVADSPITNASTDRPKSMLVSPNSTYWKRVENRLFTWRRALRRRAGDVVTVGGFLSSVTGSLMANRGQWARLRPTVDALRKFLRESKINVELSNALSLRLFENLVLLSRIQKRANQQANQSPPERASWEPSASSEQAFVPSVAQALRYMKFATAAYGNAMMRAAQLDVTGQFDTSIAFTSNTTLVRVSEHVNVPPSDIVLLDIDYYGSDRHLRHFVAIDHAHQEIILSIRGTFSLAELVVDAAGFAAPFSVGGQAHAEMAKQAEAIWQAAGSTVLEFWEDHPDYTLIITGHSLGAGTACLLNLLLSDGLVRPPSRKVRCVAFAAPPVYYHPQPSPAVQHALQQCVNFVHAHDMVPFLSVDSVRRVLAQLLWIDQQARQLRYTDRLRLFWGYNVSKLFDANDHWVQKLTDLPRPLPLAGAPCLTIPAAVNIWLIPDKSNETVWDNEDADYDPTVYYRSHRCDAVKLATQVGLQVDLNMLQDHFPPRYEHALHHFHPDAEL